MSNLFHVLLLFVVIVVFDGRPKLLCTAFYTNYKTYPSVGVTQIDTQNRQGGSRFPWEKWQVECLDGQALVGISSDRDFLDIFRVECRTTFPDKPRTRRFYPFYENCAFRNASIGVEEFYCYEKTDPLSANSFVVGVWEDDFEFKITNWPFIPYVGQALKCCSLPQGYLLVYESCFYRWTHNEFYAYYDEIALPVKCPEDTVVAGMGWIRNPIDEDNHWDWLLCCPYWRYSPTYLDYYVLPPIPTADYTVPDPNISSYHTSNGSYAINQYLSRASLHQLPTRNPSSRYNLPQLSTSPYYPFSQPREKQEQPSSWLGAKNQYHTQRLLEARRPQSFPPRLPAQLRQRKKPMSLLQGRRAAVPLRFSFDYTAALPADEDFEAPNNLVSTFRRPQMYQEPRPLPLPYRRRQPSEQHVFEQNSVFGFSGQSAAQERMFSRVTGFYAPGYVIYSRKLRSGKRIRQ